eukprot:CAMPEP_0194549388 /NCGR_PEP_ID=MMETSP0253-20130528/95136_1 /TAXON_ID=2966 /ORGANISM="Noctiluca scintillans" /LENGTH=125 /DNA_ID=CAMNT_0039396813 /DNA_START=155 /DNA_END=529 /DNA_ORIENTATION=+
MASSDCPVSSRRRGTESEIKTPGSNTIKGFPPESTNTLRTSLFDEWDTGVPSPVVENIFGSTTVTMYSNWRESASTNGTKKCSSTCESKNCSRKDVTKNIGSSKKNASCGCIHGLEVTPASVRMQ